MPYTYIITHIASNVKYYGVQYKNNSNPNDLGVSYFSSSKVLKELIKKEGLLNFKFEVRKIFETKEKAIEWESRFLTRVDAANSSKWFNLRNGSGLKSGGYKLSEVTRQRMSKPKSKEHKEKLKLHLDENRKIPEWNDKMKESLSEKMKGHSFNLGCKHQFRSEEHCKKISNFLIGNKNGEGKHNMKLFTCPHCRKEGKGGNMTRYHFDNCKKK